MSLINKSQKFHPREINHVTIPILIAGGCLSVAIPSSTPMELRGVSGWLACCLVAYALATENAWPFNWLDDTGDFRAIALGPLTLIAWLLHAIISPLLSLSPNLKAGVNLYLGLVYGAVGALFTVGTGFLIAFIVMTDPALPTPSAAVLAAFAITVGWLLHYQCKAYFRLVQEDRAALAS